MSAPYDVVVVGSGPNGLAAAVELSRAGAKVLVVEAAEEIGGGTRSKALTLPGFTHDVCSAVHPLGVLSPYLSTLPLADYGLRWLSSEISVAHPLDGEPAVLLRSSLEATAAELGVDGVAYRRLVSPFVAQAEDFFADVLAPLRLPRRPWLLLRFAWHALRSSSGLGRRWFRDERARALLAGCAAHATRPLESSLTAAVGLVFLVAGHVKPWPVAEGGSRAIGQALAAYLRSLGGEVMTGRRVDSLADLPESRAVLFDTSPAELARVAGSALPAGYLRRLGRFRYGPGTFKIDWALSGPIPWRDARCAEATTIHLGGRADELASAEAAVWRGEHPERPFVLLCQQSAVDPSRAPPGQHTGYAYCHVPSGSERDMTAVIEAQVERFAPGFGERILARHTMRAVDFAQYNSSYVGGAIGGGVADLAQLFPRPVARLDPYRTPNPRLFLGSASTPPGAGVHGMCGYWAARSVLGRLPGLATARQR